jgi:flagellar biosynthetic protein FlhB
MASSSGDKTEQPTGRRLEDARKKGQIPRSPRAPRAATLAAALTVFTFMGATIMARLMSALESALASLGDRAHEAVTDGQLQNLLLAESRTLAVVVGPVAVSAAVAVVAVQVAQGGWNMSFEALQLNLRRLSPASGIKRLIGQGPIDLLMMAIPVGLIGYLAWQLMTTLLAGSATLARLSPGEAALAAWSHAHTLVVQVTIALVALSAGDYGVQRWRHMRSLRMTKQEVKDDQKMQDGNPQIKARIRALQRQVAMRRMLGDVKKATVVITNPTHFAVALEYTRGAAAPRVVAKGRDKLALKIKTLAREHGVPTVENKPLAQALYWGAEVGEYIPGPLFEAVAEVLAYLIRLKQLTL